MVFLDFFFGSASKGKAICMEYLATFWLNFMVNVGKYSSPMEHMSQGNAGTLRMVP